MNFLSPCDSDSEPRPARGPTAVYTPREAVENITEADWRRFNRLTSVELSAEERATVLRPGRTDPEARRYLAVHWHPEWVPLDLVAGRLKASFPAAEDFLAIPTQHNRVLAFGPWAGVEADVYDRRYNLKVQLLIHFPAARLPRASAFLAMMDRTYNYRAHQLMVLLDRLAGPDRATEKARRSLNCSVSPEALDLARFYALRLKALIERSGILGGPRDEMLKNRLLPDFMALGGLPEHRLTVEQALMYIKAVKRSVKAELNPDEFYDPRQVIEEARSLGAGVVIPHPPVFWPILLSDLDVDGWEVWNPSTPHHTLFLLEALERANQGRGPRKRLLAFMGDDTHLSGKIRPDWGEQKESAGREIGFQDPWTDPEAAARLAAAGQSLTGTLEEYRSRLGS